MTIGELASSIRDIAIVGTTLTLGWKARAFIQPGVDFFKKANSFMDTMSAGMELLLTNHLPHMHTELKTMAGRSDSAILVTEGKDAVRQV